MSSNKNLKNGVVPVCKMDDLRKQSYDLLERNCNNFTHEAAMEGLRLSQGIPQWILDVPRRFLASPMGQMIRPMLENMQVTSGGNGTAAAPFANSAPILGGCYCCCITGTCHNNEQSVGKSTKFIGIHNINYLTKGFSSSKLVKKHQERPLSTPVLDSYTRPLLSNDTKTASICVKKLISSTDDDE